MSGLMFTEELNDVNRHGGLFQMTGASPEEEAALASTVARLCVGTAIAGCV